jgi:HEAT repeat protein
MFPNRSFSPILARRFRCLLLLLGGCALLACFVQAGPLPPNGVEEFRTLLDPKSRANVYEPTTVDELAERRRQFQRAARQLSSVSEVARVLLLNEWSAEFEDIDTSVPLKRVRDAVKKPDDEFRTDIAKLLKDAGEDSAKISSAVLAEVKRNTRIELEDRLDKDIRAYMRSSRVSDRIAAVNLIRDTMSSSRRQETTSLAAETDIRKRESGSRFLRDSLRTLVDAVEQLTRDSEPDVQVAAVGALADVENITADHAKALKPLLTNDGSSVAVRRATAQALGHMLELLTSVADRSRPQPILRGVANIFPVAVSGLADADADVRRDCLEACRRAALLMDDVASERRTAAERQVLFKPTLAVVDDILPAINRTARDSVPEVRFRACHVLETLVLVSHKVRRTTGEQPLPAPTPEPRDKNGPPGAQPKKKKSVAAPPHRNPHHANASSPSQWATARSQESFAGVTLERPVKLSSELSTVAARSPASAIRRVSFAVQRPDELPEPARVQTGFEGTLDAMIANLSDRDFRVRLSAVDVLETLGDSAAPAIPALVKALRDTNKFVRWGSARTLGRLAPRSADEVVPGLMALLNDREDHSVRITAAYALEEYGPSAKGAVRHLARVINRGDKEYIIAILHSIQGIGSDAVLALPNVAWILRSRDLPTSVRVEAAQTLARFGPLAKDLREELRDVMVNDSDEAVRNAASAAVLAIDKPK